jgi:hypothetical protein
MPAVDTFLGVMISVDLIPGSDCCTLGRTFTHSVCSDDSLCTLFYLFICVVWEERDCWCVVEGEEALYQHLLFSGGPGISFLLPFLLPVFSIIEGMTAVPRFDACVIVCLIHGMGTCLPFAGLFGWEALPGNFLYMTAEAG